MSALYHPAQFPFAIPEASGIYRITCTITGKFYIGSAVNLRIRWKNHINTLRRNAHDNSKLQRAWNKYGEDAFVFEILELVLSLSLTAREQYWFNKLKPFGKRGYNINPIAGSTLGAECSQATRDKISADHLGKKLNPESVRRSADGHRGKHHTPEAIEKSRIARLGQKRSAEACARIKASKAGYRKTLIVTSPDGTEYTIQGIRQFCREHALDRSTLIRVAHGKYPHHKGWKARFPD